MLKRIDRCLDLAERLVVALERLAAQPPMPVVVTAPPNTYAQPNVFPSSPLYHDWTIICGGGPQPHPDTCPPRIPYGATTTGGASWHV